MRFIFSLLLPLIFCSSALAQNWREVPEIEAAFERTGVVGTFVLYDLEADEFMGYNKKRAAERFSPASTFKIPNSLIGLWTGAVGGVDEVLPYGGRPQGNKAWEKDMSLREAIRVSNVPIYQELARRIGPDRMKSALAGLDYGNADPGPAVDEFWLDGSLKISALEQCRFLARLASGDLPVPEEARAQVRDILRQDEPGPTAIYAKTGAAARTSPQIGWWVGWLEKDGRLYAFALNIDMADYRVDGQKRLDLGRAALKALNLL